MRTAVQVLLAKFVASAHAQRERELLPRLHPQEQARYRTFTHLRRRQTWLAGRELLLALLTRYLPEADAGALRTDASGAIQYGNQNVHVSLSHSGDLLAAAVAEVRIGVDIEQSRPRVCVEQPQRLFTPAEAGYLRGLPPAQRQAGFYMLWTLKEAVAKAAGLTLWDSLRSAEFDLPAAQFRPRTPFPGGAWNCLHARIATDWHMAVAVHGGTDLAQVQCGRTDATRVWRQQPLLEPAVLHAA